MGKIIGAKVEKSHTVIIEFEEGSKIIFDMQKLVKTIPFFRLRDFAIFEAVKFDDKSIYWDSADKKAEYLPLRLSIDTILFSLRE